MAKIFKILGKNPNESMTVEEFIESYISFEEQLKIKIIKIEKYLDDLTEAKNRIEEEKRQAQLNEEVRENGLTNKSSLYLTIIEGKDLENEGIVGESNPFVRMSFQGNTLQTLVKKGTSDPAWNEMFKFEIKSQEGVINIEVLNETLLGNKSFGYININLDDLKNQEEIISWFDLSTGKGKIRMKILCIINLVNYHTAQLNKTIAELNHFEKIYDEFRVYEEQMKMPFGIIYTQDLEPLLNTENLRNSENLIDSSREMKKRIYASESWDNTNLKSSNQKRVKWNKITQLIMIILIISSFFTLLERSDFLNLFLSIIIMILFFLDKNSNIEKYLQPLILTIGGSLIYDFIWFVTQFWEFVTDLNNPEIRLKRLIYFICISNFVIKVCLIKGLDSLKKKKLYSSLNLKMSS